MNNLPQLLRDIPIIHDSHLLSVIRVRSSSMIILFRDSFKGCTPLSDFLSLEFFDKYSTGTCLIS